MLVAVLTVYVPLPAQDIVALVIQAVGGATAATAVNQSKSPSRGGHVMLGGIVFQMGAFPYAPLWKLADAICDNGAASITIYMALAAEFVLRFLWKRPVRTAPDGPIGQNTFDTKTKRILAGLTLSSLCIYVRYALDTTVPSCMRHTKSSAQECIPDD